MVKKANKLQDNQKRSGQSFFFDKDSSRRRCKSASDEKMVSGGSRSNDSDIMNVSPCTNSCWMVNSRRVYSEVHPVTQTLYNRMITAFISDLNNIKPEGSSNKESILHKVVHELSQFSQPSLTSVNREPLVQQLIPFPLASQIGQSQPLQREYSLFSMEEQKQGDEENKDAGDQASFDTGDDSSDDNQMIHQAKRHNTSKLTNNKIIKKNKKLQPKLKFKKQPQDKSHQEVTTLIEKISTMSVEEQSTPIDASNLSSKENQTTQLVFFLGENYESNFYGLCRDIKKSFFSPFDLEKIEVFMTNHQRILIGKVHHHGSVECLKKTKSTLFVTEIGDQLYSRELKGKFKVFADIYCVQKMRELINYY